MTRTIALLLVLPLAALLAGCTDGVSRFDLEATYTTDDGTTTIDWDYNSDDKDPDRDEGVECSASTGTPPGWEVYIRSDEAPGGDTEPFSFNFLVEFTDGDAELTRVEAGLFDARGAVAVVSNRSFATEDLGGDQDMAEGGCVLEGAYPDEIFGLTCDDTAPRPDHPAEALQFNLDWICPSWGAVY